MMTALVSIATYAIQLYIPATGGYFNIGEVFIYIAAIIFGPIIGGVSGGLGAALADFLGPYAIFGPGTLVIKFLEGFVIGLLSYNLNYEKYKKYWKYLGIGMGILLGALISIIGVSVYSETWEIGIINIGFINVTIGSIFWIVLGIVAATLMIVASLKLSPKSSYHSILLLIGGSIIVIGYFLYEYFILYNILGIELLAIAEIPLNIGQVVIGIIVAVPIIKIIQKSIPSLENNYNNVTDAHK
jgi:uncharacterized membrane protein